MALDYQPELVGEKPEPKETSDRAGCQAVCDEINAHWRARGYDANARPVHRGFSIAMRGSYWAVVSDLVNGFPTRRLDK